MSAYDKFLTEIARCNDDSIPIHFWWRDDDLISNSTQFEKLCLISDQLSIPVLCSIIPKLISKDLKLDQKNTNYVSFCQHGWAHINHEPEGKEKSEFGSHRSLLNVKTDIQNGIDILNNLTNKKVCSVFVPPWNRFDLSHIRALKELGFQYLSSYGLQDSSENSINISLINTHIDIIYWGKDGAHMRNINEIYLTLTELIKQYQNNYKKTKKIEAIGILSHHRVMQDQDFQALTNLMQSIKNAPGTSFTAPFLDISAGAV